MQFLLEGVMGVCYSPREDPAGGAGWARGELLESIFVEEDGGPRCSAGGEEGSHGVSVSTDGSHTHSHLYCRGVDEIQLQLAGEGVCRAEFNMHKKI